MSSSGSQVEVVVVDDDDALREVVKVALERRGGFVVVGEAADAEEAVRVSAETEPDVIVLDLGLPDLAGEAVITRMREHVPRARIVVYSGGDRNELARPALARGAVGFLEKSRDLVYLVELVDRVSRQPLRVASTVLPQEASSAREARRFVLAQAQTWSWDEDLTEALQLVVTELVTNAVVHARSICTLTVEERADVVRVEVADDGGGGSPDIRGEGTDSEHGRGLLIVSACSRAWGVYSSASGAKIVWAEVAAVPEAVAEGGGG